MTLVLITILLGIIEGVTEFVPVSSTGHLIIADEFFGFTERFGSKAAADCFLVIIQPAAILAVVVLYRQRFIGLIRPGEQKEGFRGLRGIMLLMITTLPALIVGGPLHELIPFNTVVVTIGLTVGAVGMLAIERLRPKATITSLDQLTWREALITGCFQCISIWPGMSRSASTIIGGMLGRVERKTAAEYSFLAAVPIMLAATVYKLSKTYSDLTMDQLPYFIIGFVVSFFAAMLAVKGFMRLLQRWTLRPFAIYRLALSALVFWLLICA